MLPELRHALRVLLKAPVFSALVVAVLAVGIGGTTTMFSVVNGVLLKPLPFADASRLIAVRTLVRGEPDETSNPDLVDWRASARSVDRIAGFASMPATLTGMGDAVSIQAAAVTADFFEALGVPPIRGRQLAAEDDRAGAPAVAVISATLWATRFEGDPAIVGRGVTLDSTPFTIVGVMPAGFEFPIDEERIQLWVPFHARSMSAQFAEQRGASILRVIGHLRAGATIAQAQAELGAIAARLAAEYPKSNGIRQGVLVLPLQEQLVHEYRLGLIVLLGAVAAVLLIACANVANLLLARGTVRHKEMSIRAALGAGRGRLLRQLLTESVVLSAAGGALGVLAALWGVAALVAASPIGIPRLRDVHIDTSVLLFATAVSMLTGIVFGLAPALLGARADAGDALKDGGRAGSAGRSGRTRQVLVVVEIALSVILLASAGVLMRSFVALQHVNPGFVAERALGMELTLPSSRYSAAPQQVAFYHRLLDATRSLPGAVSSSISTTLPLSGSDIGIGFSIEGQPATSDPATRKSAAFFGISPDYFTTMGIPVRKGRAFTDRDKEGAPNVIIVSETFARRYWPADDAIGKRITIGYNGTGPREVVGIVGDVKWTGLAEKTPLEMYTPFPQTPWPFMAAVVRTQADPAAVAASMRGAVVALDRDQPPGEVKTLTSYLTRSIAAPRFTAMLIGSFAVIALFLAALGLFSVMAYAVVQRRREIGIRMALGAQPSDVRRLVVSQALAMGLAGLGIGLAGALAVGRGLGSLLFSVSATDPVTFAGVSGLLLAAVLVAAYLPARRATRVEPMVALRAE
jgi:putative ABC transport system permease protein